VASTSFNGTLWNAVEEKDDLDMGKFLDALKRIETELRANLDPGFNAVPPVVAGVAAGASDVSDGH
jgi:hypothetical protein